MPTRYVRLMAAAATGCRLRPPGRHRLPTMASSAEIDAPVTPITDFGAQTGPSADGGPLSQLQAFPRRKTA